LTILLWCVGVAGALPYACSSLQTIAKLQSGRGYDNRSPRAQTAELEGWGKRASWAQANSWEALALFTAAALVCHVAGADGSTASALGIAWVAFRVVYIPLYVADIAIPRSAAWVGSIACDLGLFALAAMH
jgi:uncharacterized MAPEG superfamily protein